MTTSNIKHPRVVWMNSSRLAVLLPLSPILEPNLQPYSILDLVAKGRDEDGLPFTMAWVRHYNRYQA